jgi:hypothetical protein
MEYTTDLLIELPRNKVIQFFDNTAYASQWQPGIKSLKLIDGTDREAGARYRIVYEGRKGDLTVEERVLKRNLPDEYTVFQRSRGVKNTIKHIFFETAPQQTMWRTVNHFRFGGMMRLMAPFMKSAFSSNTLLHMERFKIFAEQSP